MNVCCVGSCLPIWTYCAKPFAVAPSHGTLHIICGDNRCNVSNILAFMNT